MFRLIRRLFGIFFLTAILTFVFRDAVLKTTLPWLLRGVLGVPADIRELKTHIFPPTVDIKGLEIDNPSGFEDGLMLDVPEVHVSVSLLELIKKRLVFNEIRLSLAELRLIKNSDGTTNVGRLKAIAKKEASPRPEEKETASEPSQRPRVLIQRLELDVGRLTYKDLTQTPPLTKSYTLNIHKEFSRLEDIRGLVRAVVWEALMKANIAALGDVDIFSAGGLKSGLATSKGLLSVPATMATDVAKEAVGATGQVLKSTTGALGSLFSTKDKKQTP